MFLNLIPGLYQIPQGHTAIIERFGKFEKALSPGLHFVNPFLYGHKDLSDWRGVATKSNYLMELTEQQFETQFRQCQTKDNVTVNATAILSFKIASPEKAIYSIDVLPQAVQNVCLNVLRSKMGAFSFDEIFAKRAEISLQVTEELEKKVENWGISLSSVEIGKLEYDPAINAALQKKRIAEAEAQAQKTTAEAVAQAAIKAAETALKTSQIQAMRKKIEAEADAEVAAIEAQAKANATDTENEAQIRYITQLSEKMGAQQAMQLLKTQTAVKGLQSLAGNSKLVLLPNEFNGMLKLVDSESLKS